MIPEQPKIEAPTTGVEAPAPSGAKWWALGLVSLLVGAVALYAVPRGGASKGGVAAMGSASMARPIPIVPAEARKGDLKIYFTGIGNVVPFNAVTIRSRVDGELVNVAFKEGDMVKEGDLLAEIDPRPFEVQLATAEGQQRKDLADHKNAQLNLERFTQAKDAISQQQIDTQSMNVALTEGALAIDKAAIDNAKLLLSYCKIRAPISGRIGLRQVDRGNIVHASDPIGLAVVTQLQPIVVVFALPQDDLSVVLKKPKQGSGLPVEVYGRDAKQKLASGTLLTFDNQIDRSTGTVGFKAVFDNTDGSLFPNQFVNARLLVDTRQNAILVPAAAVQRSPASTFVYVVEGDEVKQRTIAAGPSEGDETVVEQGLVDGETVVIEGVDKLVPGSKVTLPAKAAKKRP